VPTQDLAIAYRRSEVEHSGGMAVPTRELVG
jgi:hypothetical protein